MIPHIFHRLHLGNAPVNRQTLEWDKKLLELNPDWQLRYWRPNDLPAMRNRELYDLCENIGHRADIARYEILHEEGGVYVDWDMDPRQPMPKLDGIQAFAGSIRPFPYEGALIETEIAILGARPGHPFFDYLLSNLTPWALMNINRCVALRTGPHFFHVMLQEWNQLNQSPQPGVTLFDPPVFYPIIPSEKHRAWEAHHGSTFVHHFWANWLIGGRNGGFQWIDENALRAALRRLLAPSRASEASQADCSIASTSSTATPIQAASRASQPA